MTIVKQPIFLDFSGAIVLYSDDSFNIDRCSIFCNHVHKGEEIYVTLYYQAVSEPNRPLVSNA